MDHDLIVGAAHKEHNLRQCYQVTQSLFLWASWRLDGVRKGVTFIHGGLATTGARKPGDRMAEVYSTIGVDPTASMKEVTRVYHVKIKYAHPDGTQDPEEQKVRKGQTKRLNLAYEAIQRARGGKG